MVQSISATELRDRLDDDEEFLLVDNRPSDSYEGWHIHGAINYPWNPEWTMREEKFEEKLDVWDVDLGPDDVVVAICAKGVASAAFADDVEDLTEATVYNVDDGMEGWSEVYDVAPIPTDEPNLVISQVQRRSKGCLGYVVGDTDAGEAAVIDASRHTAEFERVASERGLDIVHVFDTHVHADHISGGRTLADEVDATYHLGRRAETRGVEYDHHAIERNQVFNVGDVDIKAVFTPGHTTEMVSYLVGDEAIMTGDTLFVESIGRTELEFSDEGAREGATKLYETLHGSVLSNPDSITVLPGHFSLTNDGRAIDVEVGSPMSSTIGYLRTSNEALQLPRDEFVDYMFENLPDKPPNYETVIAQNLGKRELQDEQEAVSLELGPNRCAATEDSMVSD